MITARADIAGETALQRTIASTKQGVGICNRSEDSEEAQKIKLAVDYKELHSVGEGRLGRVGKGLQHQIKGGELPQRQ
jgi:hypothetical protein